MLAPKKTAISDILPSIPPSILANKDKQISCADYRHLLVVDNVHLKCDE